jgi:hypothetical protein
MAKPIAITHYAAVTGKTTDTALAMALVNNPIPADLLSWNNSAVPTNFIANGKIADGLVERILLLLTELWPSIEHTITDAEVYLLLPEFSGIDNLELQQLLQAIMRQFPALLRSEHCKVFPYGRAAALMAYSAANAKLTSSHTHHNAKIWLLAVDSLAIAARLDTWCKGQSVASQAIASEAAIAVCLSVNKTGLVSLMHAASAKVGPSTIPPHVAQTAENEEGALADLFLQVASHYGCPLGYIMMPDTGETQLTSTWLGQYQHLHGVVDNNTQFELPSYFTGELGAAGGLYRFLYMYLSFAQQRLTAPLLQCEIAEKSYRAVSIFSYQSVL